MINHKSTTTLWLLDSSNIIQTLVIPFSSTSPSWYCSIYLLYCTFVFVFLSSHEPSRDCSLDKNQSPSQSVSMFLEASGVFTPFIHLPVTACVQPSMKKRFWRGVCKQEPRACLSVHTILSFLLTYSLPLSEESAQPGSDGTPNTTITTVTPPLPPPMVLVWYQPW